MSNDDAKSCPDDPGAVWYLSLFQYMYPEIVNLQLVTLEGRLNAVKLAKLQKLDFHPPASKPQPFNIGLPFHQASDILVLEELYPSVLKVSVGDQVLCAKLTRQTAHDSFYDEVQKLHEVDKAKFDSSVKVPSLRGLVKTDDNVVGFLMDFVPSRDQHLEYLLLDSQEISSAELAIDSSKPRVYIVTNAQKEKWAIQIEHTLLALHSQSIIWGDAKISNILIHDETEDAWIVDFGGGNTYGWINPNLHGTVEGDLQALGKIKAALVEA